MATFVCNKTHLTCHSNIYLAMVRDMGVGNELVWLIWQFFLI